MSNTVALKKEQLDTYKQEFSEKNPSITLSNLSKTNSKDTFTFIKAGQEPATVVLFYKTNGLTTIQYKTGKNQELGKIFHDFLISKCDLSDSNTVNLTLKGMTQENVDMIIEDLKKEKIEGNDAFDITIHKPNQYTIQYKITCPIYKESLTLNHFTTTNKITIQGRALFTYRTISYCISILLDQASLLSVVEKNDNESRVIIHEEVASQHIEMLLPNSYSRLDDTYKNLLVSSYCVKLASPELPEYSILVYADLRVLEGVIRELMMLHDLYTSSSEERLDIGDYFNCSGATSKLKSCYHDNFSTEQKINCLEEAYHFYRKNRHGLFHMGEIGAEARTTDTLNEVMKLSHEIIKLIDSLYENCDRL
ncbi:type II toxin-antitoxin system RnlA family toxin [Proteus mirabilis]|uniref:type II toxin-antitoxin system RnlA family toxin n=1 Tax=Proteus mirabilis TaxID=584 RepID=UPI001FAC7068|nr:type II toxin-antitoxin system RnlA family toxin [Proteus mirabilis]MCI9729342.1 type II toxin-antitoxin system RnlA family toxin [Proteus mirabilis]MCI9733097.1 type II toxin-antitoxin system RnlA family toxin [Proteus mirabilis]MCI9736854.1 type II toxin-antitoxin system RnlA family toxin [Proteus mirabilis]MCI9757644.1 type II toxin-antitoxin system RnlA family toxin [Proteus mirabilis]MCI9761402.1 type II toxin-antitoxin system RnlA family toxin [Proteus mirabilis]